VYHGLVGTKRESLKLKGFLHFEMVRTFIENRTGMALKSLAIPAGFEPATHGVEIRSQSNNLNYLGLPCTIGVPSHPVTDLFPDALLATDQNAVSHPRA
jgi:hypothetical protein